MTLLRSLPISTFTEFMIAAAIFVAVAPDGRGNRSCVTYVITKSRVVAVISRLCV